MADGENRLHAIVSFPGGVAPILHALRGVEELSRPFRYELDLEVSGIDLEATRGQLAHVELTDDLGNIRQVSGAIERVDLLATDEAGARVRAYLVPLAYLIKYRRSYRIFQEVTTQEIVQKILKDSGIPDDRFKWDLKGSYQSREYCVQYGETDWDFVCRLLEDEGIWFSFDHEPDGHVMVFGDSSDQVPELGPVPIRYQQGMHALHDDEPRAWHWESRSRLSEGKATVRDFDFLRPSADLTAEKEEESPFSRETYVYPGGYIDPGEGTRRAETRLQELRSRALTAKADTNVVAALPGKRFELVEHPYADGEYVITRVRIHIRMHGEPEGGPLTDTGAAARVVEVESVPRDQIWRPRRITPKPRIAGLQTALVTGPSGEEIHCDEHGRIKVQFNWDRDGKFDDKSSCWIRVTQAHTTGSVMIPRTGWEVLIQFLDGDPDRPVCLGRVFNPVNPPEYPLPDNKTCSGHRSNSLPGKAGVNEVMFDDLSGAQLISINGHYDINVKAANNKTCQVKKHQNHTVGNDQTVEIGADETCTFKSNEGVNITGTESITVGGNRTVRLNSGAVTNVTKNIDFAVDGLENMMIGNPITGVLEVLASEALSAATGAAAKAAGRKAAAVLGPILPALDSARSAAGELAQFAGPAAAIIGDGDPSSLVYKFSGLTALAEDPGIEKATELATGIAVGIATNGLTEKAAAAATGATVQKKDAAGGAAGGGGGGGGEGSGKGAKGNGIWGFMVKGDVTEDIGALGAMNTTGDMSHGVGGDSTETIGAARVELIKDGKQEDTGIAKTELVGTYVVKTKESVSIDAKGAIAITVAKQTQDIGKSHTINGGKAGAMTSAKLNLTGSTSVTLICGKASAVVTSAGLAIKGMTSVTLEGTKEIIMKPPAINPGM